MLYDYRYYTQAIKRLPKVKVSFLLHKFPVLKHPQSCLKLGLTLATLQSWPFPCIFVPWDPAPALAAPVVMPHRASSPLLGLNTTGLPTIKATDKTNLLAKSQFL